MELYLLENFKTVGGLFTFDAENENGKLYKVSFTPEDFEAYLQLEEGTINIDNPYNNTDWQDHAQSIYNAYAKGHTDYECQVTSQKLIGYNFYNNKTQKNSRIFADYVGNPNTFLKENNFTSYTPIFG